MGKNDQNINTTNSVINHKYISYPISSICYIKDDVASRYLTVLLNPSNLSFMRQLPCSTTPIPILTWDIVHSLFQGNFVFWLSQNVANFLICIKDDLDILFLKILSILFVVPFICDRRAPSPSGSFDAPCSLGFERLGC